MSRLTIHTVDTAPEAARERVEAAHKANGFLPNLIGVLANSPTAWKPTRLSEPSMAAAA